MKLRLLITQACDRACEGCCNKDWDLNKLPVAKDFYDYEMIMITGGEPLLFPEKVREVVDIIREDTRAPIILYTAKPVVNAEISLTLAMLNGITITLHEQNDVEPFKRFHRVYNESFSKFAFTRRLNVFKGVDLGSIDLFGWSVKTNIEWIKNCPLPEDEVFMRFKKEVRNNYPKMRKSVLGDYLV